MPLKAPLEEAKATADSNRLIPPYNADAQLPEEAYRLHDIIPEAELNAIQVNNLKGMSSNKERVAALPYTRSNWVNQHLSLLFSAPKPNKNELYVLRIFLYCHMLTWAQKTSRLHLRYAGVPGSIASCE